MIIMAIASVCRALAVAAMILWMASPATADSPAGTRPPRPQVDAAAIEQARSLITAGRPEEALTILRELPRDSRRRTEVLFQTGLAAIAAAGKENIPEDQREALLDEAIAALHTILIDRPGLMRVRLELARAFFLKREDSLSRRHFEQVLAGKPAAAVVANIQRFLAIMRTRRRWSAYFGVAIAPDTNINGASDTEIIQIDTVFGRLPFRRDEESRAQSGVGLSIWGGGEYQYPLSGRLRLRVGADAAQQEYEGRRFDKTYLAGHLGPRWLAGAATEVNVLADAQRRWSAGRPDNDALGARIEGEHRLTRQLGVRGTAAWRQRDYRRSKVLDGPVADFSLGAVWVATPTLRTRATLGYSRVRPKEETMRNSSRWGRLGASFALPMGFTLGASGELRWTDYKGEGRAHLTSDGTARADRTRTLRVSVLNRGVTLAGFSPQLVLVNEVRKTNAQALDYKRNRGELRFIRQF